MEGHKTINISYFSVVQQRGVLDMPARNEEERFSFISLNISDPSNLRHICLDLSFLVTRRRAVSCAAMLEQDSNADDVLVLPAVLGPSRLTQPLTE